MDIMGLGIPELVNMLLILAFGIAGIVIAIRYFGRRR